MSSALLRFQLGVFGLELARLGGIVGDSDGEVDSNSRLGFYGLSVLNIRLKPPLPYRLLRCRRQYGRTAKHSKIFDDAVSAYYCLQHH